MTDRLTLYSMPSSGNSYKLRLMLAHLGHTYTHVPLEDDTPELARAKAQGHLPQGKLPALDLGNGTVLVESNAILWYLAQGTDWIPADPLDQTRMLAWMFFEQNRHEPVIAVRASLRCYESRRAQATPERMAELLEAGHGLLAILDVGLAGRDWLVGNAPSLAEIALYAYTHSAGSRGGYDMARFPNIAAWCARVAALPGHIELDQIP